MKKKILATTLVLFGIYAAGSLAARAENPNEMKDVAVMVYCDYSDSLNDALNAESVITRAQSNESGKGYYQVRITKPFNVSAPGSIGSQICVTLSK